jgi:hypothetical protein
MPARALNTFAEAAKFMKNRMNLPSTIFVNRHYLVIVIIAQV